MKADSFGPGIFSYLYLIILNFFDKYEFSNLELRIDHFFFALANFSTTLILVARVFSPLVNRLLF